MAASSTTADAEAALAVMLALSKANEGNLGKHRSTVGLDGYSTFARGWQTFLSCRSVPFVQLRRVFQKRVHHFVSPTKIQ